MPLTRITFTTAFEVAFHLQEAITSGTSFRIRTSRGFVPEAVTLISVICNASKVTVLYRAPWDSRSSFKEFGPGWEVSLSGTPQLPSVLFIKTESLQEEIWELTPVFR